jgi:hypothetical protein
MYCEEEWFELYVRGLKAQVPPRADPMTRARRRQRVLPLLRDRIRTQVARRQRRRMWRGVGFGALTIGTAGMIVVAMTRLRAPQSIPTMAQSGTETEVGIGMLQGALVLSHLGADRRLTAGESTRVATEDTLDTSATEGAQLRLSDIASLTISPGTRLAGMSARGGKVELIRLSKGHAHLSVSKLNEGRRFHVVTPDADVQVRGTKFDVEIGAGPSPRTCVRVQEGLVRVTTRSADELLGPGETWGCAAPNGRAPEPRAAANQRSNDLKRQNVLFQRALHDERAGRHAQALRLYMTLLDRYPSGPLVAQTRANLAAMPRDP